MDKGMNQSKTITSLLCICLAAGSFNSLLNAQSKPKAEPAKTETEGDATTTQRSKSRSRRAAPQTDKPANTEDKTVSPVVKEESSKPVVNETATPAAVEEDASTTTVAEEAQTDTQKPVPEATPEPANLKAPAPPDAITELREQIEAAGTPAEKTRLQLQLVEQLVAKGSKQDAINELHSMTNTERFDPQGFYNIGNALARLGDSGGAAAAYQKAIDQRKGRYSRALNNLGVIQLRQGHWDEAFEAFTSALRLENFRYPEASYNLGRLYAARGESDLAIREWKRAISVNPEHVAARQALNGSVNLPRITMAETPAPRVVSEKSAATVDQPRTASVSEQPSKKIKTTRPGSSKSVAVDRETYGFLQTARNSRERNRQEDAVTNYQRVISRMGGYFAPANLELSYVLISLKRFDEAMARLLPVTQQDGARYPISYYHVARLYEARGDLKLAEENFNRVAGLYRQENSQFLLDLSRVREKLGDVQGALTALEDYLAQMKQKDLTPDWSDERLASLRGKLAGSQTKQ